MQDWIIYDKKEIKDRQLFLQFHGETDSLTANGKLRIIALFTYADQKRYFPMDAVCHGRDGHMAFEVERTITLSDVFFEFQKQEEEQVSFILIYCDANGKWQTLSKEEFFLADLFVKKQKKTGFWKRNFKKLQYVCYTLLLPIWIIDGFLAVKGIKKSRYIDEEIKKYEELPELEPSKEFDEKMHKMFQDAYKRESRLEHIQLGKKIAVIAVAALLVVSAAAMNIKAVREPVLNFVFHRSVNGNKTNVNSQDNTKDHYDVSFKYIPDGYKQEKVTYSMNNDQISYQFYNNKLKKDLFINIQIDQDYDSYVNQSSLSKYDKITYENHTYYFLSGDTNTLITYKNHSIISIMSSETKNQLLKIATYLKFKTK